MNWQERRGKIVLQDTREMTKEEKEYGCIGRRRMVGRKEMEKRGKRDEGERTGERESEMMRR